MLFILIYYLLLNLSLFQSLWGKIQKNGERFVFCTDAVHSLVCTNTCGVSWVRLGSVHPENSLGGPSRNDQTRFRRDFFHKQRRGFACRVCSRYRNNNCNRKRGYNIKHWGKHSREIIFKNTFVLPASLDFRVGLAQYVWIAMLSGG